MPVLFAVSFLLLLFKAPSSVVLTQLRAYTQTIGQLYRQLIASPKKLFLRCYELIKTYLWVLATGILLLTRTFLAYVHRMHLFELSKFFAAIALIGLSVYLNFLGPSSMWFNLIELWIFYQFFANSSLHHKRFFSQSHRFPSTIIELIFGLLGGLLEARGGELQGKDFELLNWLSDTQLKLDAKQQQLAKLAFARGRANQAYVIEVAEYNAKTLANHPKQLWIFWEVLTFILAQQVSWNLAQASLLSAVLDRITLPAHLKAAFKPFLKDYWSRAQTGSQHRAYANHLNSSTNRIQEIEQTLGIRIQNDPKLVKAAYRKLMHQHHPDKQAPGSDSQTIQNSQRQAKAIQSAYEDWKALRGL